MGAPVPFHDFRRRFHAYGVEVVKIPGTSHVRMTKFIAGRMVVYIAVVHKNQVKDVYVRKARRCFNLTPQDGVSDEEFNSK